MSHIEAEESKPSVVPFDILRINWTAKFFKPAIRVFEQQQQKIPDSLRAYSTSPIKLDPIDRNDLMSPMTQRAYQFTIDRNRYYPHLVFLAINRQTREPTMIFSNYPAPVELLTELYTDSIAFALAPFVGKSYTASQSEAFETAWIDQRKAIPKLTDIIRIRYFENIVQQFKPSEDTTLDSYIENHIIPNIQWSFLRRQVYMHHPLFSEDLAFQTEVDSFLENLFYCSYAHLHRMPFESTDFSPLRSSWSGYIFPRVLNQYLRSTDPIMFTEKVAQALDVKASCPPALTDDPLSFKQLVLAYDIDNFIADLLRRPKTEDIWKVTIQNKFVSALSQSSYGQTGMNWQTRQAIIEEAFVAHPGETLLTILETAINDIHTKPINPEEYLDFFDITRAPKLYQDIDRWHQNFLNLSNQHKIKLAQRFVAKLFS